MSTLARRACVALCIGLFSLAVTAVSASAAVWKDHGVNVTKLVSFNLSGGEMVNLGSGGFDCEVSATMTTEGGSVGKVTKWEIKSCAGTGDFSSCVLGSVELKNMPWPVKVNASDLTIENTYIRRTFTGCPLTESVLMPAFTTVTLDSATAITEMTFSSSGRVGLLSVDAPNAGTYGIG